MQLADKTEEQLSMNDVLQPRMKGTELSLSWVWIHHALSPGACNRLCISPLTSHWSWHPMSTTFRNRMWDTRNSAYVLLFITIPDYKKTHMDAVPEFQLKSWGKRGHVFFIFLHSVLIRVGMTSEWLCPRVLSEFLDSTSTQWQEASGSSLCLFSKDWVFVPVFSSVLTVWDQR